MANTIRHICEPKRLFLAWQAPDGIGTRFRWAVALITPADAGNCRLRYLTGEEFKAANQGRDYSEAASWGFAGYPAFSPRRIEHSDGVIESLMRRIPPRTRPDYGDYRAQFRIDLAAEPSDFAMLAVTEAKLPSDGFSVVDPLNPEAASCDLFLEVAGFRHYAHKLNDAIQVGQEAHLTPEPGNEYDPGAVVVKVHGETIGYINRLQAPTFLKWLSEKKVAVVIERLNGSIENPRAFLFVRVRPAEKSKAA